MSARLTWSADVSKVLAWLGAHARDPEDGAPRPKTVAQIARGTFLPTGRVRQALAIGEAYFYRRGDRWGARKREG